MKIAFSGFCLAVFLSGCSGVGTHKGISSEDCALVYDRYYAAIELAIGQSGKNVENLSESATALADAVSVPVVLDTAEPFRVTGTGAEYDIVKRDTLADYMASVEKTKQVEETAAAIRAIAKAAVVEIAAPEGAVPADPPAGNRSVNTTKKKPVGVK